MYTFIGIIAGSICVIVGFIMADGEVMILVQPAEYLIIFGSTLGIFLSSNGMKVMKQTMQQLKELLKPELTNQHYLYVLKMIYELFSIALKAVLLRLEESV